MLNRRIAASLAVFCFVASFSFAQQAAVVSEKQDVAVFALGYYGYDIPLETLATVDAEIQGVFVNLGRFNVFGATERFAAKDVQAFVDTLRTMKEKNTPLPDELKFGDVQMTESLYNKLFGAFVVVIPTITSFDSQFNNSQKQYETTIDTSVAFIDVANGTTFGFANISTSGSSKETQFKSIKSAIDGIAFQLTFEIRKIPVFTLNSRVLQVQGGEVKMQLGQDMGIQVGDEFAVIVKSEVAGFADDREDGLILIKNVGSQVSTGTVLYAGKGLGEGAQLREIPRLGVDLMPYLSYIKYFGTVDGWELGTEDEANSDGTLAAGLRAVLSRGFYDLRPLAGIQVNFDPNLWLPVIAYFGGEYNIYLRRLAFTASASFAVASNVIVKIIESQAEDSDDEWFTHLGVMADAGLSFLVTRNMRIYANVGAEYLFGIASALEGPFQSYGGYGLTVGAILKQ